MLQTGSSTNLQETKKRCNPGKLHFFAISSRSPPRSRRPSTATEVRWEDQTDQNVLFAFARLFLAE